MSKKFEIPKLHSKPNLMAAVAVYYASLITNDPIDLTKAESTLHEMGVNVDVLRRYINMHNTEIKNSGCSNAIISLLTQKPKLGDPSTRRKKEQNVKSLPDIECQRCGHSWKSRSRYGAPVVRCHKCNTRVDVRAKMMEVPA